MVCINARVNLLHGDIDELSFHAPIFSASL